MSSSSKEIKFPYITVLLCYVGFWSVMIFLTSIDREEQEKKLGKCVKYESYALGPVMHHKCVKREKRCQNESCTSFNE